MTDMPERIWASVQKLDGAHWVDYKPVACEATEYVKAKDIVALTNREWGYVSSIIDRLLGVYVAICDQDEVDNLREFADKIEERHSN